jgi:hypothetical protein
MISQSFRLFFINPLKDLIQGFLSYLKFIYGFIIDAIFLKNISGKTANDLLQETFKIFKIILFFIIANIAFNDIYRNIDSDLLKELISEGSYLVFFYISFLIFYYISRFYEKITSNSIHKTIVSRYLLIVMLATVFIFQIDGVMNPDKKNAKLIIDSAAVDLIVLFLLFSVLVCFQGICLLKKKLIKWFDLFYYLIVTALFLFLIFINGFIILLINGIIKFDK